MDGRNLDPRISDGHGEGADIDVGRPEQAWPVQPEAHPAPSQAPSETYYDLPAIKAAPWRWYIPTYFHVGGVSGAAATLAAAAQLAGDRVLARRLHWIATAGHAASAALLIADLGRPARFLNMLRVFRPTSPMNVGTWILSAAGASGGLALLASLRERRMPRASIASALPSGVLRAPAEPGLAIAGIASALSGAMLSTYTGVLIGNTAVPVWQATRRRLPAWFAATSAAGLASLLEVIGPERPALRVYSAIAKAADLVGAQSVERAAHAAGVGAPLHEGRSGRLWKASKWLGAASLVATLLPGRRRLAGVLGTASSVLARFAIVEAGRASAADPRATFEPQRR